MTVQNAFYKKIKLNTDVDGWLILGLLADIEQTSLHIMGGYIC